MKNYFLFFILLLFISCSDIINDTNDLAKSTLLNDYQNAIKDVKTYLLSHNVDLVSINKIIASNLQNEAFCDDFLSRKNKLSNSDNEQYLILLCNQMDIYERLKMSFLS